MRIIDTANAEDMADLDNNETYWTYNGLDSCITEEIYKTLAPQLGHHSKLVYERALRLQAPLIEMQLRGLKVDLVRRKQLVDIAEERKAHLTATLDQFLIDGLGMEGSINPNSHVQVKSLLYGVLGLPVIKERSATTGRMGPSSSRTALEKLSNHFYAEPICNYLLAIRDVSKQISFLKTSLGPDARMRCSFNSAGTKTGRLNSKFSDFGDGTNLQNVNPFLRQVFIPDSGMCFVNIDLEQADSRNVGAICWEILVDEHGEKFAGSYLDACESGDLHTQVASMAYANVSDRATADLIAYRDLTYRDLSKKLGHGSNYYGQPPTMAAHAKLPVIDVVNFQRNYFGAFPCIPLYHEWTISELQGKGYLTNLFGRRRHFFDRREDQSTINSAIAYSPQGMTGEEMNIGMINLWQDKRFQLLVQVHDSILFQCNWREVNELVPIALKLLETHLQLKHGRDFYVPLEATTGYNWGYRGKDGTNPNGLSKFKGNEDRSPPRRTFYKPNSVLQELFK